MARFYIACGGTGGHLYPGLAIAEQLHQNGHQVRLFVSPKKIDQDILSKHPEFEYSVVRLSGFPGLRLGLMKFMLQLAAAYLESRRLIRKEKPKAVLGMGGFSCVPVLIAAAQLDIHTYIHESNVLPGKATRLLSKRVDKVLIGLRSCKKYLQAANTVWTGTPVRSSLVKADTDGLKKEWGIPEEKLVVAVTGGSQGARGINRLVCGSLKRIAEYRDSIYFIHLTGLGGIREWQQAYQANGFEATVLEFSHEIEKIFAAADFVVTRAGAGTLTECAWFGLPAILVPYPYAAEKHQDYNAKEYVDSGGGVMVLEGPNAESEFVRAFSLMIADADQRQQFKSDIMKARVDNAVERVIAEIGGVASDA